MSVLVELAEDVDEAALRAALRRGRRPTTTRCASGSAGRTAASGGRKPGRPTRVPATPALRRLGPGRRRPPAADGAPGDRRPDQPATSTAGRCCPPCSSTPARAPATAVPHRAPPGRRRGVLADPARRPGDRVPARSCAGAAGRRSAPGRHARTRSGRTGSPEHVAVRRARRATWRTGPTRPPRRRADAAGRPRRAPTPSAPADTISVRLGRADTDALLHQVPAGLPHPGQRRAAQRARPGAGPVDRPRPTC